MKRTTFAIDDCLGRDEVSQMSSGISRTKSCTAYCTDAGSWSYADIDVRLCPSVAAARRATCRRRRSGLVE